MNENLHDIDKLFKSAIEQHQDTPSPAVWDNIDNKLDKSNVIDISKKYNNLKRVAAVLLLLLSGVAVYEYRSYRLKQDFARNNPAPNQIKANSPEKTGAITTDSNASLAIHNVPATPSTNGTQRNGSTGNVVRVKPVDTTTGSGNNHPIVKSEPAAQQKNSIERYRNSRINSTENSALQDMAIGSSNTSGTNHKKGLRRKGSSRIQIHPAGTEEYNNDNTETTTTTPDVIVVRLPGMINTMSVDKDFSAALYQRIPDVLLSNTIPSLAKTDALLVHSAPKVTSPKPTRLRRSGFSINPFFSPDYAFYGLKNDKPQGRGEDRHDIKNDEKHSFSYSTGVLMDYNLTNHLSLQSGILYTKTTINSDPKNIYAVLDNSGSVKFRVNGSCGYVYILPHSSGPPALGDSLKTESSKNELAYIQIPLSVKYNIAAGKLLFSASAGIGINILAKGTLQTVVDNGISKESQVSNSVEGLKKSYTDGLLGLGLQYSLTNKIALTFTPTARIALTPITNGAAVKTYSNSIGLAMGMQFRF